MYGLRERCCGLIDLCRKVTVAVRSVFQCFFCHSLEGLVLYHAKVEDI